MLYCYYIEYMYIEDCIIAKSDYEAIREFRITHEIDELDACDSLTCQLMYKV